MTRTRGAWRAALLAMVLAMAAKDAVRAQDAGAPPADVRAAGPALRAAIARLAVDPEEGRERLAEIERAHPIIADHAAHQRIASLHVADDAQRIEALAAEFRRIYPHSLLLGRVAALEALAAIELGEEPHAREALEIARREAETREQRAAFALAIARSLEREGLHAEAARAFVAIWRDEAPTAAAREALTALEDSSARGQTPPSLITARDWAQRCRELSAAFWNDEALTACAAALAGGPLDKRERERLAALRAELLFRDRRYAEAERAFAALPDSRENRFWRARSLARSGKPDDAKAAFERLGAVRDDWGARGLFLAGTLYEDDDGAKASERYRQALALAKRAELRIEARWRLAWRAYREQRWNDAALELAALAADTVDPIEALRPRYWRARALARAGDARGTAQLASIARDWGFTYYGQRSAAHSAGAKPEPDADEALLTNARAEGAAPLPSEALLRPRILLEAGLSEDAGAELRALASRTLARADLVALAALLQDAGQFDVAKRLVLDAYSVALAAGPRGGEPDLWWAAYPQAFAAEVEHAASKAGIPPELLYAVMREESGFRPGVLSVVGARGLVQIMPETGRRIASRLGAASYSPDELFVPARNLELGAAYLAELLARFEGRVSAAVASYNAGPEAVERWLGQNGSLEDDEWIEAIPYDQTRSYAKRVLRSFAIYQALY
jgi:soluble lytic murein transglycosylase